MVEAGMLCWRLPLRCCQLDGACMLHLLRPGSGGEALLGNQPLALGNADCGTHMVAGTCCHAGLICSAWHDEPCAGLPGCGTEVVFSGGFVDQELIC